MTNTKIKTAVALLLILASLVSLCACGKAETDIAEPVEKKPEYVYTADFKELGKSKDYLDIRAIGNSGYYSVISEKVGDNTPEGVIPEYEGQYASYAPTLYFTDLNGHSRRMENYRHLELPQNSDLAKKNYTANSYFMAMAVADSGDIVTVESVSTSYFNGPDGMTSSDGDYYNHVVFEETPYIRLLDSTGAEKSCAPIDISDGNSTNFYNTLYLDGENNIITTGDKCIRVIGLDGKTAYKIEIPGEDTYVDYFIKTKSGQIGVFTYGNGEKLSLIDLQSKKLGDSIDFPVSPMNLCEGAGDYDFYYTSGINCYGYKLETKTAEKLFSWIDIDVDDTNILKTFVNSDGNIQVFTSSYNNKTEDYTRELATVLKVASNTVPHKEIIKMAAMSLDYDVKGQIYKYNRSNQKYRIRVTDYSEYNTGEDYTAGRTKLYTEIMAGNIPDILALDQLNYRQLASKGLLADLYPYIDADKELNRADFFPTVLKALEVGGQLCTTCSGFSVNTLVGSSTIVGDKPGWTYEQYRKALNSMPQGCQPFDAYATKADVLSSLLSVSMSEFVDWATGTCKFDSDQFINILKMTDDFPQTVNLDESDSLNDSIKNRLTQGKQMLVRTSVYNLESTLLDDYQSIFANKATYVGYPVSEGTGNSLSIYSGLAISSKSEHKDAAWEFLRVFFTKAYQKDSYSGLPTNMKVYNEKADELMTVMYQKDNAGNYKLDEKGEKIPMARAATYDEATGQQVKLYALSQEQVDKVTELINTTTKVSDYNSSIYDIVNTEVQAYFAGQKSAEEVARLIQSKANIYVNEQR